MSKPNMHPNATPQETHAKGQRLKNRLQVLFSGAGQTLVIQSDIFDRDPADPRTHLAFSAISCVANDLSESPVVQQGQKQVQASNHSRQINAERGTETENLIRPIAKEILEKNPALSTSRVADRVVERLNGAVGHSTARRYIAKIRKEI
jgi:hypothetical protein